MVRGRCENRQEAVFHFCGRRSEIATEGGVRARIADPIEKTGKGCSKGCEEGKIDEAQMEEVR